MVKNDLEILHSIKKYRKGSHNETDVWHIWKVDSRTIRWDLWNEYNMLEWFCMETFIFDWWWRSRHSLARKSVRIFRFCVMPWKDEREPTKKCCLGGQVDVVQKFITIQNFGHNWWWTNGIREYISQDSPHCASATKSKSSCQKWAKNQKISQEGSSSCRCSTTSHGDLKKTGMRIKCSTRFELCKNIFTRKMVLPRIWIRKQVVFYSWKQTTRTMGQSRRADDDQIRRKQTPSLPIHNSIISRTAQKQNWWKIVNTLLRWWRNDWNCFSHNYFCLSAQYLRSSLRFVWRMQILPCENRETCFGVTIWPIVCAHKCDENIYTFDQWSCASPRTSGQAVTTKIVWLNFVMMQDCWQRLMSDSTAWVTCRGYTLPRDEKIIWPEKLDSREHQNWARIGSHNQLPTRLIWSGNWNWIYKQRQFSLVGQNFSWLKQVGHEHQDGKKQETSEMQFEEYTLRLNAGDFARRSQRQEQNHKNEIFPAHLQEPYLFGRELGLMLNQENSRYPIIQCPSSSSWMEPTSTQWWSDWILENQRQFSETFFVLSSMVW